MNALHKRRLRILADFLETLEPYQLDMETWRQEKSCGTVACAAGWATTIPEFKAAGFKMRTAGTTGYPIYGELQTYGACAAFFGLDYEENESIFSPSKYEYNSTTDKTEAEIADVVKRIREVVANHA